jgi:acyl-ACP thioesterase
LFYEQDKTYTLPLCGGDFYKTGLIHPSAILNLAQRVVDTHLASWGMAPAVLVSHHLSWVFILSAVRILHPIPDNCVALNSKTWMSLLQGPYYRREIEFYSPQGEKLICVSSYSVLLDLVTRTISRPSALPFPLMPLTPIFSIDNLSPKLSIPPLTHFCYEDAIKNSHIDLLGHVNNSYYADFALDCLTDKELSRGICEMDINFLNELKKNSTFSVLRGSDDNGTIWTKGQEKNSDKTSFTARIKLFEK